MKSGSTSAVAFGRVLQAVRKRLARNQADVAGSFNPPLSVAAVSMAESGNRPPKTEALIRGYAVALELDDDALLELWWALQGMLEENEDEHTVQRWWKERRTSFDALEERDWAQDGAQHWASKAKDKETPNNKVTAPKWPVLALAYRVRRILIHLLGNTWKVDCKPELGLNDPAEGRAAAVMIELRAASPEGEAPEPAAILATFACPEPLTRPNPPAAITRVKSETFPPDIAWILSSVEAMPARERVAVAGFIRGLREGANLFAEAP